MVTNKPRVTIGVCVRNSARTIRETIESIVGQDFPHELMEVIFVDDGSEDETFSIIKEYAQKIDMQVKILRHNWRGLGYSRNRVIENAEGDYIIWIDGDMVVRRDFVRRQVDFMEKNQKVAIAKGFPEIASGKNLISDLENIGLVTHSYLNRGVSTSKALGAGGSIYRVRVLREIGGFDVNMSGAGEDIDVEERIRKAGWITYLGVPALFFERPKDSLLSVWREGVWYGYGDYHVFIKNRKIFSLYRMNPIASLLAGALCIPVAYKLTHRKIVFLMPLLSVFKNIAWCFGFLKNQLLHALRSPK